MPARRMLTMRQLRRIMRMHHEGASARESARCVGMARSTVQDALKRGFSKARVDGKLVTIGITRFASMAGLAALPALLPAFEKAAWLGLMPEFNPFKYNSFPVNAARQSYRLTDALQRQVLRLSNAGRLTTLAPMLTFQSVLDFTVSTPAIISGLYAHLPENGSELVLFDVNRTLKFGPLMRPAAEAAVERLLPTLPQRYRITIIANAENDPQDTVARTIAPGQTTAQTHPLGIAYPMQIFSLSHVALPFPMDDSLYGLEPNPNEFFGANLGAIAARGERGALIVNLDSLFRIASNPFFPYMLGRIEEGIADPAPVVAEKVGGTHYPEPPRSAPPAPAAYPDSFPQPAEDP